MKKILSVILVLSIVLSSFALCATATTEGKQYRDYKVYTLLGDSVASGYDDVEKNLVILCFFFHASSFQLIFTKLLE